MNTMLLPVKLTKDELLIRGNELSEKCKEVREVEDRKKDVTSALGGEIKALEIEVLRLSRIIGEKREDREVAVYERVDKESRRMETIREDTAEVVSYRPLRPEECNLELWPAVAKS